MKLVSLALRMLAALAVVAVVASANATAAQAQAAPQCGPNNWVGNLVPDNPWGGADFTAACVEHDRCYSAGSPTNRRDCDVRFYGNMTAACYRKYPNDRAAYTRCGTIAGMYFQAVRRAGGSFYKGSGQNN